MEVWDWTCHSLKDADKMSSPLQGATMKFRAEWQQPKRGRLTSDVSIMFGLMIAVLEIGSYTGYSALAWYKSTVSTQAEVITLELDPKMIAASRRMFEQYKLKYWVTPIEGPPQNFTETLNGEFDNIFVNQQEGL